MAHARSRHIHQLPHDELLPGIGADRDSHEFRMQPGLGVPQYAAKFGPLAVDDQTTAEVQESRHGKAFHDDVFERKGVSRRKEPYPSRS